MQYLHKLKTKSVYIVISIYDIFYFCTSELSVTYNVDIFVCVSYNLYY